MDSLAALGPPLRSARCRDFHAVWVEVMFGWPVAKIAEFAFARPPVGGFLFWLFCFLQNVIENFEF